MDLFDHLMIATVLAVRDSIRDEERRAGEQQRHRELFMQKCKEYTADAIGDLHESVAEVLQKAHNSPSANEAAGGISMLPLYAFAEVVKAQGGAPAPEQTELIKLYFKGISVGFSVHEFLDSLRSDNKARRQMTAVAGISEKHAGTFWLAFFNTLYATNSDENALIKAVRHFSAIAIRFAILGGLGEQAAVRICERFADAILKQAAACRKLPGSGPDSGLDSGLDSELDNLGKAHYFEYMKNMADIYFSLFSAPAGPDDLEPGELFNWYITILLYELLNRSSLRPDEKADLLDRYMRLCKAKVSIGEIDYSGPEFCRGMENRGPIPIYGLFGQVTEAVFKTVLVTSLKKNRGDDGTRFILQSLGFLMAVEKELSVEKPFCGFGSIALEYIGMEVEKNKLAV